MTPASATPLPAFDQAQVDKRFLAELDRLLQAGVFASYREWARAVQVNPNYVAAIASGRYHANLKLLYETGRAFAGFDFAYVVFGSAVYARPEPTELPKRGRWLGPRAREVRQVAGQ